MAVVDGALGTLKDMGRAVVTIDALHFKGREGANVGAVGEIGSRDTGLRVSIFDPGDGLALLVGCGVADVHTRSHVRAMDATESSAAHEHHQGSFGSGVGFVVFELAEDAKTWTDHLFAGVALLAGFGRGNQTIALHGRLDRTREVIEGHRHELAGSGHFRFQPASGSLGDVAGGAFHGLMRSQLMGGEFRLHYMAGLAAELNGFHVSHRAVTQLTADQDVPERHDAKEEACAAPCGSPVRDIAEARGDPPARKRDPDGDQQKSGKKHDWNGDE